MTVSVFQIVIENVKFDILPSYASAMRRFLEIALADVKHGTRVATERCDFVEKTSFDGMDSEFFAIRYVLSTMPKRRDVEEHRLSTSVEQRSLVRLIGMDTEFDPSYEILKSVFWVRNGYSKIDAECRRLRRDAEVFMKMRAAQGVSDTEVKESLLDVQARNLGRGVFHLGSDDHSGALRTLGDAMQKRLRFLLA